LRFRRIEQWRDRLVKEGPTLIPTFLAETSAPIEPSTLTALIEQARKEHSGSSPPHASRELFRVLRNALER
jgi:ribosome-associated protein